MSLAIIWAIIRHWASAILTPPGSWIALALAVFLAIWWVNDSAYNRGVTATQRASAESAASATIARLTATYIVRDRSDARTDISKAVNEKNRSIANAVKEEVAAQSDAGDVCVDPYLADRLRDIQ